MPTDMVRLPARGPVAEAMVDRRTGRTWTVEVSSFEIAATVVTAGQWNLLLGRETEPSQAHFPKVEVSWRQAVLFCNEISLRGGLNPSYSITTSDPPTSNSTWTPRLRPVEWCRSSA